MVHARQPFNDEEHRRPLRPERAVHIALCVEGQLQLLRLRQLGRNIHRLRLGLVQVGQQLRVRVQLIGHARKHM